MQGYVRSCDESCKPNRICKNIILGRRCKFDFYGNLLGMSPGVFHKALPHNEATTKWGGSIKRAGTYKGIKQINQGHSCGSN